jgi:hypothetical protein
MGWLLKALVLIGHELKKEMRDGFLGAFFGLLLSIVFFFGPFVLVFDVFRESG